MYKLNKKIGTSQTLDKNPRGLYEYFKRHEPRNVKRLIEIQWMNLKYSMTIGKSSELVSLLRNHSLAPSWETYENALRILKLHGQDFMFTPDVFKQTDIVEICAEIREGMIARGVIDHEKYNQTYNKYVNRHILNAAKFLEQLLQTVALPLSCLIRKVFS